MIESRRLILKTAATAAASVTISSAVFGGRTSLSAPIKIGLIADTHIGFVDDAADRFKAFMRQMATVNPDALIQLGDFAYPEDRYQEYADAFNAGADTTVHVIGNHDLDRSLKREDCMRAWAIPSPYYTRVTKGLRFIVLDGNDEGSPTHVSHGGYASYVGIDQQRWLDQQLLASPEPVLIVSHQPLAGNSAIDNAKDIRAIISRHKKKVLLCINGHSHVDQRIDIDGVSYLHINSASYYWIGGKVRLLRYRDPLYATMRIEPSEGQIKIEGIKSDWSNGTPHENDLFKERKHRVEKMVVPEIRSRKFAI